MYQVYQKKVFPAILLLFSLGLKAQNLAHSPSLDGCPENSRCNAAMSLQRKHWLQFLQSLKSDSTPKKILKIEEYRKKSGLPIEFWSQEENLESSTSILWDSPCSWHQKNKKIKTFLAMAFIQNTIAQKIHLTEKGHSLNYPIGEKIMLDPMRLWQEKKGQWTYQEFLAPSREFPLMVMADQLLFLLEDQSIYFGLKVSSNGEWQVISPPKAKVHLQETTCPQEIETATKNWPKFSHSLFYEKIRCFFIWDESKQEQRILQVMSC